MAHVFEIETDILAQLIFALNRQLQEICWKFLDVEDPDALGYYDSAEHITGLGFVTCQTYMATVYGHLGIQKQKALNAGPRCRGGETKARIINHAANYWKHNNEWALDRSPKRREAIERTFESVGFPVGTSYPLSNILTGLISPKEPSFVSVIEILELWKADLCTA